MRCYISIEKNLEGFELYKALWTERGVIGFMANTMAEGIEKVIEIEKTNKYEIYFVDIVADDIENYMPLLKVLSEETDAPILIATSNYDEIEREKALINGADAYGAYSRISEVQDVKGVISVISSIDRRARKKRLPSQTMVYKDMVVVPYRYQRGVFVGSLNIDLTRRDFDILYYLMKNYGKVLTYRQIYRRVWGNEYEDTARDVLWTAIKRLREKLNVAPDGSEYIETVLDVGYCIPLKSV